MQYCLRRQYQYLHAHTIPIPKDTPNRILIMKGVLLMQTVPIPIQTLNTSTNTQNDMAHADSTVQCCLCRQVIVLSCPTKNWETSESASNIRFFHQISFMFQTSCAIMFHPCFILRPETDHYVRRIGCPRAEWVPNLLTWAQKIVGWTQHLEEKTADPKLWKLIVNNKFK